MTVTPIQEVVQEHLKRLSTSKRPVIGWCCSYFPVEVIESFGLIPFRILPVPPAEMGDAHLDPNFCPYIRAVVGEIFAKGFPFLSGLVVMNTCDGMRRLYDALKHFHNFPFLHLMDLPRKVTPAALEYFREEIRSLLHRVSAHFGIPIAADALKVALENSNRTRSVRRELQEAMACGQLPVTGRELFEIFRAGEILPRHHTHRMVEEMIRSRGQKARTEGLRILLTGSMMENPYIFSMIESSGGRVVAQDLCVTGRKNDLPISLEGGPLIALARHYLLKPSCARMQDISRRIEYIQNLIRLHGVQGVIYYVMKFCDTFLYEIPPLKQVFDLMSIPMLIIESDYRKGYGGGMQTRIEAFLEMVGTLSGKSGRHDERAGTCMAG